MVYHPHNTVQRVQYYTLKIVLCRETVLLLEGSLSLVWGDRTTVIIMCPTTCTSVLQHVHVSYCMYKCPTTCTCVLLHVHVSYYIYMCPTTFTFVLLPLHYYFIIQVLCTKYIKGEDQIANLANTKVTITKLK